MQTIQTLMNTYNQITDLQKSGNHWGVLCLLDSEEECEHIDGACDCGERDWDLEAKDNF